MLYIPIQYPNRYNGQPRSEMSAYEDAICLPNSASQHVDGLNVLGQAIRSKVPQWCVTNACCLSKVNHFVATHL